MELVLVGSEEARCKDDRSGIDVNGYREEDAGLALIHKKLQEVKGRKELGLDPTDRVFIKVEVRRLLAVRIAPKLVTAV